MIAGEEVQSELSELHFAKAVEPAGASMETECVAWGLRIEEESEEAAGFGFLSQKLRFLPKPKMGHAESLPHRGATVGERGMRGHGFAAQRFLEGIGDQLPGQGHIPGRPYF